MSKDNRLSIELVFKMLETIFDNKMSKNTIKEREIVQLLVAVREIIMSQPMLLELEPPINVCGDIHGQFDDLKALFDNGGWPPGRNYLFLGDYVDRGPRGLETIVFLLGMKLLFPENFFLLRGNHECEAVCKVYGFFDECKNRYSGKLWRQFCEVFEVLPVAAVIGERIFCCHGGLSPEMVDMTDVRTIAAIKRPCKVPKKGLLCDLLWADPAGANEFGFKKSVRGVSQSFGADVLVRFLHRCNFDLLCRGHEVVENGYEFFANKKGVTLFSAANYCGEFDNSAAMMLVGDDLSCSFTIVPGSNNAMEPPEFLPPKHCTLSERMQMSLSKLLAKNLNVQHRSQAGDDTEELCQAASSSVTSSDIICNSLQSSSRLLHFRDSLLVLNRKSELFMSPDYVALESISRFITRTTSTSAFPQQTAGPSKTTSLTPSRSSQTVAPSSVRAAIPKSSVPLREQKQRDSVETSPAHCHSRSSGRSSVSSQRLSATQDKVKRSIHQFSPVFPDRSQDGSDIEKKLFPLSNRTPTETSSSLCFPCKLASAQEQHSHDCNAPEQLLNQPDSKPFRRQSAKHTSRKPSEQSQRLFSQILPQHSTETSHRLSSCRSYQECNVHSPSSHPNQPDSKLANAAQASVRFSQTHAQPTAEDTNGHLFDRLNQSRARHVASRTPSSSCMTVSNSNRTKDS